MLLLYRSAAFLPFFSLFIKKKKKPSYVECTTKGSYRTCKHDGQNPQQYRVTVSQCHSVTMRTATGDFPAYLLITTAQQLRWFEAANKKKQPFICFQQLSQDSFGGPFRTDFSVKPGAKKQKHKAGRSALPKMWGTKPQKPWFFTKGIQSAGTHTALPGAQHTYQ